MLLQDARVAAARCADVQCLARGRKLAKLARENGAALLVPPVAVLKRGEELELGGFHGLFFTALDK